MPNRGPVQTQSVPSRAEITCLAISLVLFLCLGVLVSARYPFVWVDEVLHSDAAVNFASGRGFTSTAWPAQQSGEFWAGNVPLYQFLLVPWLKVFGISIISVRSIGYAYLSLFLCLSLIGGTRLGLLCDRASRFCFLGGLIGGYAMIFSYGGGRYDPLGMVLVGACVLLYSTKARWIRLPGFSLIGCLLPWTGFQLLPFVAVSGILIWLYLGRRFFPTLVAIGSGSVLGLAGLLLFYSRRGVLDGFIRSMPPTTLGQIIRSLLSGAIRQSNNLPKDFSLVPMFLGAVIVVWLLYRKEGKDCLRAPAFVSCVIALAVSIAFVAKGHFPTYYSWMAYLPLIFGVSHSIGASSGGTWVRRIGIAACVLSGSIGVSLHALNLFGCWTDRSYSHVEKLISQSVSPGEHVYAEFAAFYALHPITKYAYYPEYLSHWDHPSAMTDGEKAALDVLVIYPYNLTWVNKKVGGQWEPTGQQFTPRSDGFFGSRWELGYLSLPNYGLAVYRRAKAPAKGVGPGE
jgi:hypothetical protein